MKKIRKIKEGSKICGVCQGIAKAFNLDVSLVRGIWILVALLPPVGFLATVGAYAILAYLLPEEKDYIDI